MTDTAFLGPDAQARIDRAREQAGTIIGAAQADADRISRSWMESRIQPDMSDWLEAKHLAESPMIE
jgi:cell division septum initiation protein DivIVA